MLGILVFFFTTAECNYHNLRRNYVDNRVVVLEIDLIFTVHRVTSLRA